MKIHHIEKLYEDSAPFSSEKEVKRIMYTAYRYAIYDAIAVFIGFLLGELFWNLIK